MDQIEGEEVKKILAMVISIGGTPAPIIKSIMHYKPEFVSFLASQDTADNIADIKKAAHGTNFKSEITIVENVNDLLHCYNKADEAIKRVVKKKYEKDCVIVDYTGGTKNMSVSLALAAINHGFSFSYVGGKERTKNGTGIVIDGAEEIYQSVNPWDVLAIEERKQIALLFNKYQFQAARQLCDLLSEKSNRYRFKFKKLSFIIEGYHLWDLFRHKEAFDKFKKARIQEALESDDLFFSKFAEESINISSFLQRLAESDKKLSPEFMLDLFANAERRFIEGKIDDAILRFYRLVEMLAQERLSKIHNIDTADVLVEKIPASLRDEYMKVYRNTRDGKIRLPQGAAFNLLFELQDELGILFENNKSKFLNIQSSRNQSYLAHGFSSSKEQTYLDLRSFIIDLGIIPYENAPKFPQMEV
ncbi:MAG TPA: TIGR02710 family CRISPR-associated CARF protein [Syntrophorhabdaceae bacterium]|nr:TIGR02710 family CRISPR-associated CARF protein [Syntrophorhabdaceae bacterium]